MPFDGPPNNLDVEILRLAEEPTAGLDPLAEVGLPDRKLAWIEAPKRLRADQVVSGLWWTGAPRRASRPEPRSGQAPAPRACSL